MYWNFWKHSDSHKHSGQSEIKQHTYNPQWWLSPMCSTVLKEKFYSFIAYYLLKIRYRTSWTVFSVIYCYVMLMFLNMQVHTWFSLPRKNNRKYPNTQPHQYHFHGFQNSSYTLTRILCRNFPVWYSTCKQWKYSNVALYQTLFNAYGASV